MHRFWFGHGRIAGRVVWGFIKLWLFALIAYVLMLLWNWLMPDLFPGTGQLDYWRSLGLLVMCRILFGGRRGGWGHWHRHRKHWENLTPEEREQLKARFQSRWHKHHADHG